MRHRIVVFSCLNVLLFAALLTLAPSKFFRPSSTRTTLLTIDGQRLPTIFSGLAKNDLYSLASVRGRRAQLAEASLVLAGNRNCTNSTTQAKLGRFLDRVFGVITVHAQCNPACQSNGTCQGNYFVDGTASCGPPMCGSGTCNSTGPWANYEPGIGLECNGFQYACDCGFNCSNSTNTCWICQ